MEITSSLILTKIRPPVPRSRAIPRTRLFEKLTIQPDTDLVLVCAPAGYGKTTLLVEWIHWMRQVGVAVAWYSLDESDNSPETFGAYLITSLSQALGIVNELDPVGQLLRVSPETDLRSLLPMVINVISLIKQETVLVLDDYHLIKNPYIHQVLEFLLNYRSDNLHLVIGTRINPPLPLARLRVKNRLIELRVPDLRFTIPETQCFLRDAMQLDLSDDQSSLLAEQVEGWAAGLQLAALSLSGRKESDFLVASFNGSHRQLTEYLLEEVVNHLPEELQSFLLYSSVLERMSAPICDAVLGLENSDALLKQVEQMNLFLIALNDDNLQENWYRYHHLFKDFLQAWLNSSQPERAAELNRKAAIWYAEQGLLRDAAYHAFHCGDWQFAADFVEKHSFTLIIQSEIATIYEWCTAIPEAVLRKRPKLNIFKGLALAFRFQGKNRARVEACLQQANQALALMNDPDQTFEIEEFTAVVKTLLAMIPNPVNDAQNIKSVAQHRLKAYSAGDPGRFTWLLFTAYADLALNHPIEASQFFNEAIPMGLHAGLYFGYIEGTFHLARLTCSQGRLKESLEICRKAQTEFYEVAKSSTATQSLELPALGCLDIAAGCVFLEMNDLDEAERLLRLGLKRMGWSMNPFYLMTAYLAQFRLYEIQGRMTEALACLDQLNALWPDLQDITKGFRVQTMLNLQPTRQETIDDAREWIISYLSVMEGKLPVVGLGPIGTAEVFYQANLIWARLQILLGYPSVVKSFLEQQIQLVTSQGLQGREIDLRLLQAQMYHKNEEKMAAFHALEKALQISQRNGHVNVFIQNFLLDELIHQTTLEGIHLPNLQKTLNAIRGFRNRKMESGVNTSYDNRMREVSHVDTVVDPLTARELEILQMVASGVSNQDIASQFVITIGTVKSHLHHLFAKLGVRNRTEAVSQARKLGLIN